MTVAPFESAAGTRGYDRAFDWIYSPPPAPPAGRALIGVVWDGLALNTGGADPAALCAIVENVDGWVGGPPADGHDAPRAVADGSAWGPKTLGARTITVTGVGLGPRGLLAGFRDQLAMRAAKRQPAPFTVTDGLGDGRALTASTRAGTDALAVTWLGNTAFRYQAVVTAADPLIYEDLWQTVILRPGGPGASGRPYQRVYSWSYSSPDTPSSAILGNTGNSPAPVWALFAGDLVTPELRDDAGNTINLATLDAGIEIVVATDDLTAYAAGGVSRASYILPGSRPMLIPALASARWSLYSQGSGSVTLAWRSAWT
jgi:hypothetical protein